MPFPDRLPARGHRVPPLVVDAALAALVGSVTVITVLVDAAKEDLSAGPGGWALLGAQSVALVWRRRAPQTVAIVNTLAAVGYGMADLPDPPIQFAPVLALATLAAYTPRRVSVAYAAAGVVAAGLAFVLAADADAADVAVTYFTMSTAWFVGDWYRVQRERAAWLEDRRADAARNAVAEERVRIARDLHDVVAHHVSVIAVQAEAAQEVLAGQPERASRAMSDVADTARTALGELRRLLGVLRSDGTLAPQPDLAAVDELAEPVRRAGVAVEVRAAGGADLVAGLVGVTGYRVVQEALTNVLRHAGAGRAEIDLAVADGWLVVAVADDGRGGTTGWSGGAGQGLAGMRERVELLGGSLTAGPRRGGGFAVRARLPLETGVPAP